MGEQRVDRAPDHQPDDAVDGGVGDRPAADLAAVAQHGEAVAQRHHLVEAMGDEDDAETLRPKVAHDAEQLVDLGRAQRRSRLVHDDEPRSHRQSAGDLDHLLLGDAEIADQREGIEVEAEPAGDRAGLRRHAPPADEQARPGLAADEDVLRDRHVGRQGEFLVDGHDAAPLRVMRRRQLDAIAGQLDRPGIGLLRPGQDLEQRRLPGAVLAEQRMDLAGAHREVDVVERLDAGKALGDPHHAQQRRGGGSSLRQAAFSRTMPPAAIAPASSFDRLRMRFVFREMPR